MTVLNNLLKTDGDWTKTSCQQKIWCMPQSVVNMGVNTHNKHCRSLKNNRLKMRHAPYSNRWQQPLEKKFRAQENRELVLSEFEKILNSEFLKNTHSMQIAKRKHRKTRLTDLRIADLKKTMN